MTDLSVFMAIVITIVVTIMTWFAPDEALQGLLLVVIISAGAGIIGFIYGLLSDGD